MKTEDVTSYALGELHGASREAFEKELASSPAAQNELQETTDFCERLFAMPTPQDSLADEQRVALLEECSKNMHIKRKHFVARQTIIIGALGALAACLLIVLMLDPLIKFRVAQQDLDFKNAQNESVQNPINEIAKAESIMTSAKPVLTAQTTQKTSLSSGVELASSAVAAAPARGFSGRVDVKSRASVRNMNLGRSKNVPAGSISTSPHEAFNTETYDAIQENSFLEARANPLSTFSIDVDTASYSNVRRFLQSEQLPPAGAVRIEEMINYFPYDYPQPSKGEPFSINVEVAHAPWAPQNELVRIGLKGRDLPDGKRPSSNLVFLIDVSGSMDEENKLPLLKRSLRALVEKLSTNDHIAIVTYAGASGLALPSTAGSDKSRILAALDTLEAGGSTNGAQGIRLAYDTARENFLKEGNNRVILCTDGDFNVGVTNQSELVELIEKERASNVFLSVLGFGDGNLKDSTMEKLADKGNGNYAYIDTFQEGRKVLVEQMGGTLFTIAKDVKIQVEFNPARVASYRLIGYENRLLAKEDFNNDKKDAGEIGAGHTVTALYEIVPAGQPLPDRVSVDPLKYQTPAQSDHKDSSELLTVKLRYKAPNGEKSQLIERPIAGSEIPAFDATSQDFQFAAAVAAFGMKLRKAPGTSDISWKDIQSAARSSLGNDPGSYRAEFLTLVEKARNLSETPNR